MKIRKKIIKKINQKKLNKLLILGQSSFSTAGKLIAAGIVVPGTISITATELYFDADEEDPIYKAQNPQVF